jgi:hypothetical protein
MIMGRKAPGRSYYVADIPFKVDRELALVSEFYGVARRLLSTHGITARDSLDMG